MGFFNNAKGITVSAPFKLQGSKPIDPRFVAASLTDAQMIVNENGGYNGLKVWIEDEGKFYTCIDKDNNKWTADGTADVATDEEVDEVLSEIFG